MRTIKNTVYLTVLFALTIVGSAKNSMAQYSSNDTNVREIVRRIQDRTMTLRADLQSADLRSNVSTSTINDLNRTIGDFSTATTQLDRRLSAGRASASDVRVVLDRASSIDNIMTNSRIGFRTQRDWQAIRSDLDLLARAYAVTWNSGTSSTYPGYNQNDAQIRQLIQRIDTSTTNFSRALRQDLNRRSFNNRYPVDQVRTQLSEFETALTRLRNRFNNRQASGSDVQALFDSASYLNNYVTDERLSSQTENNWNILRPDLEQLASAFNVAWNWSTTPGDTGYGNSLTGTYRVNTNRGDDAKRSAEAATRNMPASERQRVYESLLRRLDPPNMLAIEQRGNAVTIASTRASQINFVADGTEHVETTPKGRTIRVRANLSGNQLSIQRTGDRADDFTVAFEPIGNNQLLVTRTLYNDRLNQPVVLRTYYDRTSDVAQLNLYETNPQDGNIGSGSGDFVIPSGTQVVAVLNDYLSTRDVSNNQRFTMTVRSPAQYQGATIEGNVLNVDRGGRVSGRSEMTLNFDTIRLRDGRSYKFAGILDGVRLPNGDVVNIDNEGAVREDNSQTSKTVTRAAIGTAVGAIIGAIAGGGKGAAIGAVVGAGAGAGSVYIQGRNDLELPSGTEVTIRTTGTRY